jgi:hypothetical protein
MFVNLSLKLISWFFFGFSSILKNGMINSAELTQYLCHIANEGCLLLAPEYFPG